MNYLNNINFEGKLNHILNSNNNANTRMRARHAMAEWEHLLRHPGLRFNKSSLNFKRIQNKITTIMRTRARSPSPKRRSPSPPRRSPSRSRSRSRSPNAAQRARLAALARKLGRGGYGSRPRHW
jgi:hypothetical protein